MILYKQVKIIDQVNQQVPYTENLSFVLNQALTPYDTFLKNLHNNSENNNLLEIPVKKAVLPRYMKLSQEHIKYGMRDIYIISFNVPRNAHSSLKGG